MLRILVPSALRAPAAPHFYVEAVEKLISCCHDGKKNGANCFAPFSFSPGCRIQFVAMRRSTSSLPTATAHIEDGEVKVVVDQVVEGVYEGAWDELPFEINGEKARTGIDRLVAGHSFPPPRL